MTTSYVCQDQILAGLGYSPTYAPSLRCASHQPGPFPMSAVESTTWHIDRISALQPPSVWWIGDLYGRADARPPSPPHGHQLLFMFLSHPVTINP